MPLNHGRAILTVADLEDWQHLMERALMEDPELAEAMLDPRRVFNQESCCFSSFSFYSKSGICYLLV